MIILIQVLARPPSRVTLNAPLCEKGQVRDTGVGHILYQLGEEEGGGLLTRGVGPDLGWIMPIILKDDETIKAKFTICV